MRRRAFTLVELLVVMAIILVIAGVILPALRGPLEGVNLTGSADNVTALLSFARQTAMSRNLAVEVRIYKRDSGQGRTDWNTVALLIPAAVANTVADEWLGNAVALSGNVIIDPGNSSQGSAFSTVITKGLLNPVTLPATSTTTAPWTPQPGTPAAQLVGPGGLNKQTYVAFRYLPDGSTNLPEKDGGTTPQQWCLTLRNAVAPLPAGGVLPATNFVALVIDPATGRLLTFRP